MPCPCGTGRTYGACCEPVHQNGAGLGTTAESLMRARYTAYVLNLADFLLASWHPDTRPPGMGEDPGNEWLGLEVLVTERGGALDNDGVVEFRARFRRGDDYLELHEVSTFTRVSGRWVYVDGDAS